MTPLFSLIIPVYNVEPYLKKCLDSIRMQSFDNWEAILINDGSPDRCGDICEWYASHDKRFRVIHQPNGGVSRARNAGLSEAHGKWIWFVDPDDWIDEDSLEKLCQTTRVCDCDLVIFGINYYNEDYIKISEENRPKCIVASKNDVIKSEDYPPQNYILLREIIENNNLIYSEGVAVGEDLEFQYKCLALCKLPISIDQRLYNCLRRKGSAMRNKNSLRNSANCSIIVLEHIVDFIINNKIKESRWLTARVNRTFKNVLSSNALIGNYNNDYQRRFRKAYKKLKNYGFKDFSDSALVVGFYSMRTYGAYINLRKIFRQ